MKRFAFFTTILTTLGFFSACNSSDSIITCDRYDQWMASCSNCSMTVACEDNYDTLAPTIQLDLDDCADFVLMDNLGVCGDWNGDVQACVDLGATYLDIVCTDYWCGDGFCDAGETEANCPADCDGGSFCGDGTCDANEDAVNCAADCEVVVVCDDGVCDAEEDPVDCPQDCAYLVCDDYSVWLTGCFDDCDILASCEAEYGVLDVAGAQAAWDCAMELADAADAQMCLENTDSACDVLLEEELGSDGTCIVPGK